jgi:hypothetical protein
MGYVYTIGLEFELNREFSYTFCSLFSIHFFRFPPFPPGFFWSCLEFSGFGVSGKERTSEQGSKHARFCRGRNL